MHFFFWRADRALKAEFFSSPFLLQELFFATEEFACLVLNLTIPFKLYVADATEAIEVLKNYLGANKKGMSYAFFIFYLLLMIDNNNNNNCKINNGNNESDSRNVNVIIILKTKICFELKVMISL